MNTTPCLETLTVETRIVSGPDVIFAELGNEVSLLNTRTGVYHTMNAVASSVWQHAQHPTSLREIARRLMEEYDVDPARCTSDLLRLVEELRARDLVVIASE